MTTKIEIELIGGPLDGERRKVDEQRRVLVAASPKMTPAEFMRAHENVDLSVVIPIIEYVYVQDPRHPHRFYYRSERSKPV